MAISDLGIVNSALIKLGVATITALNENSRNAKLMNEQFSKVRDALLYDHPWNFAMKWVELTQNGNTAHGNPDFSYEANLPADCLRVWTTEYEDEKYEVMNEGKIYSDSEKLKIKYIKQVTDPTKFTPAFAEALALKLAADNCFALVQSNSLKNTFIQEMEMYLPRVRSGDAQENPAKALQQDVWLNARH